MRGIAKIFARTGSAAGGNNVAQLVSYRSHAIAAGICTAGSGSSSLAGKHRADRHARRAESDRRTPGSTPDRSAGSGRTTSPCRSRGTTRCRAGRAHDTLRDARLRKRARASSPTSRRTRPSDRCADGGVEFRCRSTRCCSRVLVHARHRRRASGAALIEQHEPVHRGIEEPPMGRIAARARAAVQEHRRTARWIAAQLVDEAMSAGHFEHAGFVRLDRRIEIGEGFVHCEELLQSCDRPSPVAAKSQGEHDASQ